MVKMVSGWLVTMMVALCVVSDEVRIYNSGKLCRLFGESIFTFPEYGR